MMQRQTLGMAATILVLSAASAGHAQSNIDPINRYAWSENSGWLNWRHNRPSQDDGVRIYNTYLGGYIWGENIGWISLGDDSPAPPGGNYANNSDLDFGVNRDPCTGYLSGYAWSENEGWIDFGAGAPKGQPARVDRASGIIRLRGFAWCENTGWINLDDATDFVELQTCPPPGSGPAVQTYLLTGNANNIPWAWRISSPTGAFIDLEECFVPGVPNGGALAVAQAFAGSINSYGCGAALSATAFQLAGFTYLSISANSNAFNLYVGASNTTANCFVTFALPACTFNPEISQVPLPGNDCNENLIDDLIDLAAGTSNDNNQNGVPDECELIRGDMNCDGSVDNFDIDPFVIGLVDPEMFEVLYPDCNINSGDVNGDGSFNNFDIDPFVTCVVSGGC